MGSDQVWNPIHMKGDDTFLLGFLSSDAYKISFSSSFAIKTLPYELENKYKELLKRFKFISVREKNGQELIKNLIGRKVSITLDPTLMLNRTDWGRLTATCPNKFKQEKYIVLYIQNYAFNPAPYIYELLINLQKETGLKVYSLSHIPSIYQNENTEIMIDASPITFLQVFEGASYVVTSSFHGTAFALNFTVPLFSVVSNKATEDDRQVSLLKSLGLEKCIIKMGMPFKLSEEIIYDKIEVLTRLESLRKESMNYLCDALKVK